MADSHEAAVISFLTSTLTANPVPEGVGLLPLPPGKGVAGTYITVEEIISQDLQSLSGVSDYANSIMQIRCWNTSREVASTMRARVKSALVNRSGSVGSLHIDGSEQIMDTTMVEAERSLQVAITRIRMSWTS